MASNRCQVSNDPLEELLTVGSDGSASAGIETLGSVGDRVGVAVQDAVREELVRLREEQEHHAHHDRHGRVVHGVPVVRER